MPSGLRTTFVVSIALASAIAGAAPQSPSLTERLDRYAAGEYAAASFTGLGNPEGTVRALETESRGWIRRDPAAEPRRRLMVASFALEAAGSLAGTSRQVLARRLIVWSSDQVRGFSPAPARLWHLAAIALVQRAGFRDLLVDGVALIERARTASPGERRFVLAAVVEDETRAWSGRAPGPDPANRGGILPTPLTPAQRVTLQQIARRYHDLAASPDLAVERDTLVTVPDDVRAEARLRRGFVLFHLGDLDEAVGHLTAVPALTRDPHLVSLAHLFLGVVHHGQGRAPEAIARYREALRIGPRGQSATVLLSAALMAQGRHDEAAAVSEALLAPDPPPPDPWRDYWTGDARHWSAYLADLREALR